MPGKRNDYGVTLQQVSLPRHLPGTDVAADRQRTPIEPRWLLSSRALMEAMAVAEERGDHRA